MSDQEIAKAMRYRTQKLQERAILSQGFLRVHLAGVLKKDPTELRFYRTSTGKPFIQMPDGIPFEFNLSHSKDWMVLGYSTRRVGIDLEYRVPGVFSWDLASSIFSAGELKAFSRLPASWQNFAFYRAWTMKEAILKMTGEGLGGLKSIEVPIDPASGGVHHFSSCTVVSEISSELSSLDYASAIAAQGRDWEVIFL